MAHWPFEKNSKLSKQEPTPTFLGDPRVRIAFVGAVGLLPLLVTIQGASPVEPPYSKTNLITFLAEWKLTPGTAVTICKLKPEWVGTTKRVFLRDPMGSYKEEPDEHIRFSHLRVRGDHRGRTNVSIVRGRLRDDGRLGSYLGSEAPIFTDNLPSTKAVSEAKNLDALLKMFGPQHSWTDGWGGPNGKHWTEGWTWFTKEGEDRLRYLSVFAHVSRSSTELGFTGRKNPSVIRMILMSAGLSRSERET